MKIYFGLFQNINKLIAGIIFGIVLISILNILELYIVKFKNKKNFNIYKKHKYNILYAVITNDQIFKINHIVNETWGKNVKNHLYFFVGENSKINNSKVIKLPTVLDNIYPPQKKSFIMLYYIYQNFLSQYNWILRCDDDVYVNTAKLELFVKFLDSSFPYYIGKFYILINFLN